MRIALVLLLSLSGCGIFGSGGRGVVGRIIDCAQQSIRERGILYVGAVNDILASPASDGDAKARLARLGADAGQDVIGCILFDQSKKFRESSAANPNDRVSAKAYDRATDRLEELEGEGYRFE